MKNWHCETIVAISVIMAPNRCSISYSERGSKTAVVTVLRPKIAYDNFLTVSEIQHDHQTVFAATTHVYWPANKNVTWNQHDMELKHKTAYLKLSSLPLSPLPLFFSTQKLQLPKYDSSCSFCLPLAHANDVLFLYSNVRRSTVYHVIGVSLYSLHACCTQVH